MLGLLLLDKPAKKTSYGAVACIKRISGEKRVGHTGTLDPLATGVLPVLLGRATALSSYLLEADKCYTARVRLGIETDSCDITGAVTATTAVTADNAEVLNVLERFCGEQLQQPPMFSALKKNGVRLYEMARRGETVDIPARNITVYSLTQTVPLDENYEFEISARVSKGTYIRSLVRDIGRALGCGATLTALRRTETSGFDISDCVRLDTLTPENISGYLLPAERAVSGFPAVRVTEKQAVRFCNGGQLSLERLQIDNISDGALYRVCMGEIFLGLGIAHTADEQLAVRCVIHQF